MRILVWPAMMEIGGSQLNAIELAARVQSHGHDVVIYGPDGTLVPLLAGYGLEYVRATGTAGFSRTDVTTVRRLVQERGIQVAHAYESWPAVNLAAVAATTPGLALVTTVMSMSVPAELPRYSDLIVGFAALRAEQEQLRERVYLMEPPIDVDVNRSSDPQGARRRLGLSADSVVCSVVCRLTDDLGKLPGVVAAIQVVDRLADSTDVQLVVAGEGHGLAEVERRAAAVNRRHDRQVVLATGGLLDPTDAYDCADIVLGMGSSALKGMAFGKPLVVQGPEGFWRLLDEDTVPLFMEQGFYGVGGGGESDLEPILTRVLASAALRERLGVLGRALVVDEFGLDEATAQLIGIYEDAVHRPRDARRLRSDAVRTAGEVLKLRVADWDRDHLGGRLRAARHGSRMVLQ